MEITYEMYQKHQCGKKSAVIPLEQFADCCSWAEAFLHHATMGRLAQIPEEKAVAILCKLAEMYYENRGRNGVLKETTDGYSVTYAKDGFTKEAAAFLATVLGQSGLLYRGLG